MANSTFNEGKAYRVAYLRFLDTAGSVDTFNDVTVVFTSGWAYVEDDDEQEGGQFVIPRERVVLVEGVTPQPRTGRVVVR